MTTLVVVLVAISVLDAGLLTLVMVQGEQKRRRKAARAFARHAAQAEAVANGCAPVWTLGGPETEREFNEIIRVSFIAGGER